MSLLKAFLLNRIGWVCVLINGLLLLFGIYEKGFERGFHLYHEPRPIQIFIVLNLPGVMLSALISDFVNPLQSGTYFIPIDNLTLFSTVLFSLLQWLAIGFAVSSALEDRRPAEPNR